MKKKTNSVYEQTSTTGRKKKQLPDRARGNPVYEHTSESQPLCCCGILFGRNARLAVFVLSIIGIALSIWLCESADYFKFTSIRNDTFFDREKFQPEPFEYAKVAKVGLFWYQIEEVFRYPWPPPKERMLFQEMLQEELERLESSSSSSSSNSNKKNGRRNLQTTTTTAQPSETPTETPSVAPSATFVPSVSPSMAPTPPDPNKIIAESVQVGVALKYPNGMDQFGGVFYNAQLGGLLGPIFCGIAFLTGLAEYCFCSFKYSWLPTGIFLFLAFFFQTWTLFLFVSDDFCKYQQECRLGWAGVGCVFAVLCYLLCQIIVCCAARPTPLFNLVRPNRQQQQPKKKKQQRMSRRDVDDQSEDNRPKRKKKKKRRSGDVEELGSIN